ncbi:3-hydroxy-3-methylglutaryl coenzyme A synthase [Elasticomyces elasticus]|nr:3-hydroxy-3-methylglutaryl coenzyme A synthase [Elasticomyces elasticus]
MQLFADSGNTEIEGVDTVNACYGGTSALFNAVNWIESRSWDGRDALVVTGDIAVYDKGPARPTGGAGMVAMLVGPDAPLIFESGRKGTYMRHVYDFYKPDLTSEYPVVDGHFSNRCYLSAVDACYAAYSRRSACVQTSNQTKRQVNGHTNDNGGGEASQLGTGTLMQPQSELDSFHFMCFHTPNCKLVAKSYARLFYNDYLESPEREIFKGVPTALKETNYEDSLEDRTVEKTFMALSAKAFAERVAPSIQVPKLCGNMYTASLYSSLASLLSTVSSPDLQDKRIGLFSYGSGLASSLFSMRVVGDTSGIAKAMDIHNRLDAQKIVSHAVYEEIMELRENAFLRKDYIPLGKIRNIAKGVYYLTHIDDKWRRFYSIA